MTIPLVCICMAVPKPLFTLLNFLHNMKLIIFTLLFHLGLNCSTEPEHNTNNNACNASSIESNPTRVKTELKVVQLGCCMGEDQELTCLFCLEKLEVEDEVRKLGNCGHFFHRECLDKWIDLGQLSCPTCRSPLLPTVAKLGGPFKFLARYRYW